jgi:methionine-rich copper-binding protein CopC
MAEKLFAAFVLAVTCFATSSSPALAHAALGVAEPAIGSTVQTEPTNVRLTFDDGLQGITGQTVNLIEVRDAAGVQVDRGETVLTGATITVQLANGLTAGNYKVIYRVLSADGHPVSGQYQFAFRPKVTTQPSASAAAKPSVQPIKKTSQKPTATPAATASATPTHVPTETPTQNTSESPAPAATAQAKPINWSNEEVSWLLPAGVAAALALLSLGLLWRRKTRG